MIALTLEEIALVSGGTHENAEAFMVGCGAGAFVGSFASPFGAAVGCLGGGVASLLVLHMMK